MPYNNRSHTHSKDLIYCLVGKRNTSAVHQTERARSVGWAGHECQCGPLCRSQVEGTPELEYFFWQWSLPPPPPNPPPSPPDQRDHLGEKKTKFTKNEKKRNLHLGKSGWAILVHKRSGQRHFFRLETSCFADCDLMTEDWLGSLHWSPAKWSNVGGRGWDSNVVMGPNPTTVLVEGSCSMRVAQCRQRNAL